MKKIALTVLFISFALTSFSQKNYLETFSGGVKPGNLDGPIQTARFRGPTGLAINKDGNVLVADYGNHNIKLIDLVDLAVLTVAGTGTPGFTNGTKELAQFYFPTYLTVDSTGNVFVIDYGNKVVRKIDTSGMVTTALGSGQFGYKDGPADSAKFSAMGGLVFDDHGDLYVSDIFNNRIRKLSPDGNVTTFAGGGVVDDEDSTGSGGILRDGKYEDARFYNPSDLVFDKEGVLWVSDYNNGAIRKIDKSGNVSTFLGTIGPGNAGVRGYKDGEISEALFNRVASIAISDEHGVIVVDDLSARIRQIKDDTVTTIAGSVPGYRNGEGLNAKIGRISGTIIQHPKKKNTFILGDPENHAIRLLILDSLGKGTTTSISLNDPSLSFYPNPTLDFLNLDLKPEDLGKTIQILSLNGSLIFEKEINETKEIINLDGISTGFYLLKVDGYGIRKFEKR